MFRVILPAILGVLITASTAPADRPPRPRLGAPIDYAQWLNAQHQRSAERNAADTYRDAASRFVNSDDAMDVLGRTRAGEWSGDDRLVLEDWLHRNEQYAATLHEASRLEHCYFARPAGVPLVRPAAAELAPLRTAGELLGTRARLRLGAGRVDDGLRDVHTLLRCADHMAGQPTLAEFLVSLGLRSAAYDVLIDMPRLGGADFDYPAILRSVRTIDARPLPAPLRQIELETVWAWDLLQRTARDDDGDGRFERLEGVGPLASPASLESLLEAIDAMVRDAQVAFAEAGSPDNTTRATTNDVVRRGTRVHAALLPDVQPIALAWRECIAQRNAARLVLNLHAKRGPSGEWPATIELAMADEPEDLRRDPFSGGPLCYRLVDGKPIVYSVGLNRRDDGGRPSATGDRWSKLGDAIFWPVVR